MFLLFLLLIHCRVGTVPTSGAVPPALDDLEPAGFMGHFIDEMNIYGNSYDIGTRFDLEKELLVGPAALMASELPGLEQEQIAARIYFRLLKSNGIRIAYSNDFEMVWCDTSNASIYGALVEKEVILPDGTTNKYQDFIELIKTGDKEYRIKAVFSSRFPSFSALQCRNVEKHKEIVAVNREEKNASCQFLEDADQAYHRKQYQQALLYYELALKCGGERSYVESKIAELSTAKVLQQLLQEAESHHLAADYHRALQLYESALKYDLTLAGIEQRQVQKKIQQCKDELLYAEKLETGHYYFQRGLYQEALPLLQQALRMKPGDGSVAGQVRVCEEQIRRQYQEQIRQEIAQARQSILSGRDYEEALITLMRYDDSDLIDGELFFYMAQIMDGCYNKVKKAYNLRSFDCCVLTKRYLIRAQRLGYRSEDLDNIRNDHFNNRSRTCGK